MPRRLLFGLLVTFGLLAVVYSLATPLFEAPDEPLHYAYVRWLAEGHGLPRLDGDASGTNQEAAQPPLYYAAAALVSGVVDDEDLPELFWHNPQFGFQAGGTVNDNKNMLIHTEREGFPWRDAVLAVRLARFVSLFFGLLTIVATYGLTREILPGQPLVAVVAAAVVAFTPQFIFMSSVVSNDAATAAVTTLALWALARIARLGLTPRRTAAAGLALGLALLSKTSALLLLLIAVLALAMGWKKRTTVPAEASERSAATMILWRDTALMFFIALLVGGWWYARNLILFGDPLGLSIHVNTLWGRAEPASLSDLLPELPQVFRSFWGAFGWGHVELAGSLYVVLGTLIGLAVVGWVMQLVRVVSQLRAGRRTDNGADAAASTQRISWSTNAGMLLLAAGWCVGVFVALLRWMQQVEAPHGRLLFPALGAWGLLLAVGWSGLLSLGQTTPALLHPYDQDTGSGADSHSDIRRYVILVPVVGLFLLALAVPFAVIRPAFALPRLSSPEDATQGMTAITVVYDGQARLLSYRVTPESAAAGERVKVTLCWEALTRMDHDYTLFIHLLGRDNLRVGERTSYPGQGRFPTTLWPVGRAFCDSYWVDVAPWAPAPELYAVEVGLYDDATGWRLPAQDVSGQSVEPPVIGLVRITPAAPPPQPKHTIAYDLGGQIALVGYDSSVEPSNSGSTTLETGDTLTLTLHWEALQEPQGDYKVFVHVLDEIGTLVAQDDAAPRGGGYPTWAWQPGDLVPDVHQVTLPDERPPGPYYWWVGMYNPDTLDRLPANGPEGPVPNGAIPLGEVRE